MGTIHLGKNVTSPALVLERGLSYLTCLAKTAVIFTFSSVDDVVSTTFPNHQPCQMAFVIIKA